MGKMEKWKLSVVVNYVKVVLNFYVEKIAIWQLIALNCFLFALTFFVLQTGNKTF